MFVKDLGPVRAESSFRLGDVWSRYYASPSVVGMVLPKIVEFIISAC